MHSRIVIAATVLWLALVAAGFGALETYMHVAGAQAAAHRAWPGGALLGLAPRGCTLVMVAHPQCPCTAASLDTLQQILASAQPRPKTYVVFVRYAGVSRAWIHSRTWNQARSIPGVIVAADRGGVLARRFGALTSGQTYLYDSAGRLLFHGGLTSGRGMQGDCVGAQAVLTAIASNTPASASSAVYGCPLFQTTKGLMKCPSRP